MNSRNTNTASFQIFLLLEKDDYSNKRHVEICKHLVCLVAKNKNKNPLKVITVAQISIEVPLVSLTLSNLTLCDVGKYILTIFLYKLLLA